MLLKEAYQRRIAESIYNHSPSYLKIKSKPPSIGSAQLGRIDFQKSQTFFNENDISQKVQKLKIETKQFSDPDYMQLKKKKWNISVQSPKLFDQTQEHQNQKLFQIKHGFYDFVPKQIKQKKIYQGTQTRDSLKGWNVSVDFTKKQKNDGYRSLLISSLDNTVSFNQKKLKHYLNPSSRYKQTRIFQRQRSIKQSDLQKTLKQKYKSQHPDASPQRINATISRLLQQTRRAKLKQQLFINKDELQMTKKFKASLSDSQKIKITQTYHHNGCWSKANWAENTYAWSCCMNQDINGKGCVKKVIDANRPNFSSFNNN